MGRLVFSLLSGGLFGFGLLISGMTDTRKVQGWLDIFGAWDPTLAFVMGGAILSMAIAWRIAPRMESAVLGGEFPPPPAPTIGRNLVLGSLLFGIGWGIVGLCPGPAIASLGFGGTGGLVFLMAMITGMIGAPSVRARIDRLAA